MFGGRHSAAAPQHGVLFLSTAPFLRVWNENFTETRLNTDGDFNRNLEFSAD